VAQFVQSVTVWLKRAFPAGGDTLRMTKRRRRAGQDHTKPCATGSTLVAARRDQPFVLCAACQRQMNFLCTVPEGRAAQGRRLFQCGECRLVDSLPRPT